MKYKLFSLMVSVSCLILLSQNVEGNEKVIRVSHDVKNKLHNIPKIVNAITRQKRGLLAKHFGKEKWQLIKEGLAAKPASLIQLLHKPIHLHDFWPFLLLRPPAQNTGSQPTQNPGSQTGVYVKNICL